MKCPYCNGETESGATKCRHCGEWLDEASRKKAEAQRLAEEKSLERERIRERDRQQSRKSLGCCAIIFAPFVLLLIIFNAGSPGKPTASPGDAQKAKDSVVADLAPKYCATHQKTTVWLAKDLQAQGYPSHTDGRGEGFTQAQCKGIMSMLYDVDQSADDLQKVVDSKYWVGQDYRLLYYSIGTPNTDNQTQTVLGTQHQLVYDWSPKTVYIYFVGETVSSIQN